MGLGNGEVDLHPGVVGSADHRVDDANVVGFFVGSNQAGPVCVVEQTSDSGGQVGGGDDSGRVGRRGHGVPVREPAAAMSSCGSGPTENPMTVAAIRATATGIWAPTRYG